MRNDCHAYRIGNNLGNEQKFVLYKLPLLLYTYICEKLSNTEMRKYRFQVEV